MPVRSKSRAVSELIEDMFDESRYNSRARPGADSGENLQRTTLLLRFLYQHSLSLHALVATVTIDSIVEQQ